MRRVLFLTPHVPGLGGGAPLVTLGRLQALERLGARVRLLRDGPVPGGLALPCERVEGVGGGVLSRMPARVGRLLASNWVPSRSPAMARAVRAAARDADVVVLDGLQVVEYGRLLREQGWRGSIFLHAHNIEHRLLDRERAFVEGAPARLALELRVRRFRAVESALSRYCDGAIALTAEDRDCLARLNPGLPVHLVAPGVDVERYRPEPEPGGADELLFIGSLRWSPNLDGLSWFMRTMWPLVRRERPQARLTVVGRTPPDWLQNEPGLDVRGFVADERPDYARARVVVAPLRFGSGVRIKILNALAMRRAVVSTTLGAEGIPVVDGESVLLRDQPEAFAHAVLELMEDEERARRLADAGLRVCVQHYGPDAVAARLGRVLFGARERPRVSAQGTPARV